MQRPRRSSRCTSDTSFPASHHAALRRGVRRRYYASAIHQSSSRRKHPPAVSSFWGGLFTWKPRYRTVDDCFSDPYAAFALVCAASGTHTLYITRSRTHEGSPSNFSDAPLSLADGERLLSRWYPRRTTSTSSFPVRGGAVKRLLIRLVSTHAFFANVNSRVGLHAASSTENRPVRTPENDAAVLLPHTSRCPI